MLALGRKDDHHDNDGQQRQEVNTQEERTIPCHHVEGIRAMVSIEYRCALQRETAECAKSSNNDCCIIIMLYGPIRILIVLCNIKFQVLCRVGGPLGRTDE
jgi:hypothetical protein